MLQEIALANQDAWLKELQNEVEKLQQRKAQLIADLDGESDARDQFHRQKVRLVRRFSGLPRASFLAYRFGSMISFYLERVLLSTV